jgi:hypothetical protein
MARIKPETYGMIGAMALDRELRYYEHPLQLMMYLLIH